MKFRGVEYSAAGEELMRALGKMWRGTDDADERAGLNNEADVIHAFHESFPGHKAPGLIFHESGREPQAVTETSGDATSLTTVSLAEEPASRPETLWDVA